MLDVVESELNERFHQEDLLTLQKLEDTLLTGQIDSVCCEYPEINSQLLAVQLPMFRHNYQFGSSMEAASILSALRRLKTWLRSSMSQKRQNHVAVCHVHQDKLDLLDNKLVCQEFVVGCERRKQIFGAFI